MALETGTYISDLVSTNPTGTDNLNAADDHMRLTKATLLATFPEITGAMNATHTELNMLDGVTGLTGQAQYAAEAGAADVYTATMTPTITTYVGAIFWLKISATNTGACTLNIDSVGAKNIKLLDGTDPAAGDLQASGIHGLAYDGTQFILVNPYNVAYSAGEVNYQAKLKDGGTPGYVGSILFPVTDKSAAYTAVAADGGTVISYTGTYTLDFTAPATLTSGWSCFVKNAGTGNITLDADSVASTTIDGLTDYVMYPGEVRLISCNGTVFTSVVVNGFAVAYTSGANTFTKPPGYTALEVELWGAGGGGGSGAKDVGGASGCTGGGGGGGGGYKKKKILATAVSATETVTIGAGGTGGAAVTANTTAGNNGVVGANTTFGSLLTAFGGGYGLQGNTGASVARGGGGGGSLSAGIAAAGGHPKDGTTPESNQAEASRGFGGAFGPTGTGNAGGASGYGGGSGGSAKSDFSDGTAGGSSAYGGAGGGGGGGNADTDNDGSAGGSQTGADSGGGTGGDASESTAPVAGTTFGFGGGGGYSRHTATAGATAGAAGGAAGGGGGGGAGENSAYDSGAGGAGGAGYALITGGAQ